MIDLTREAIAYTIVGAVVLITVPLLVTMVRRQQRKKLRRKGIKRYGVH